MSTATAVEHGGGFREGNNSGVISRMKTNPIQYMSSLCLLLSFFLVQRLDLLIMKLSRAYRLGSLWMKMKDFLFQCVEY